MTQTPSQTLPSSPASLRLREDALVSVCFNDDIQSDGSALDTVTTLAAELEGKFRFYEILVVVEEDRRNEWRPAVLRIKNFRLLVVRNGTSFYQRRVIAAEEAIGDVVLLTCADDISLGIDALGMIERAIDEDAAVLATCKGKMHTDIFGSALVLLGRGGGIRSDIHDLQTFVLPRAQLNQLLAHPDTDLILRFPPRDFNFPLVLFDVAVNRQWSPFGKRFQQRLSLLHKLLVYLAPRILAFVSLASAFLAVFGLIFALYVIGVWIFAEQTASGWLTLSASLSMVSFFIGISITGLSLGLQQLLSIGNSPDYSALVDDVNRADMFGHVISDLNVETGRYNNRQG